MFLRRVHKATNNEWGFSFVELMIAVTLMGLVLIPMFNMFDFGLRTQVRGEQDLIALNLCQSRLESLLAEYYEHDCKLLTPMSTTDTIYLGQNYTIISTAHVPNGRIQQLNVKVAYKLFGQEKTITLTTRVVEY
jgi:Tfp pilus assembly protein FimT